ncbi:MAG: hypothetical protein CMN28_01865 [Salinisphaeraceae bacterium]|nr:hypothetical protein [Salinisphaeraceae bacterium]
MRVSRCCVFTTAGLFASCLAVPAWSQGPTLESLEDREIVIEESDPVAVDPAVQLDNYRRLMELTREQDPATRVRIMLRLAQAELEASADATDPKPSARKVVQLYQEVLAQEQVSINRANVLYNLAQAADLAGEQDVARDALNSLIQEFPASRYTPEARFRRAEALFVDGDFEGAARDYEWLIKKGDTTPFYRSAKYKQGWSQYKLSNNRESLNEFTSVLRLMLGDRQPSESGDLDTSGLSQGDTELAEDSLRGIILNFAQLSGELTPAEYVDQTKSRSFEYLFHKRLFDHYLEKERYTDASETALAFAERNPEHPESKRFELGAITALEQGGFPSLALERKEIFVKDYGIDRKPWFGQDPLDVPEVRERLDKWLDEITKLYHAAAQKSKKPEDYDVAAEWYARALEIFPEADDVPQTAFLRGEVLFEAGRFDDAAQQYNQVAYEMGEHDKAGEAAYAALLARRKAAENVATDEQVEQATLRFAQTFPAHPDAANALALLAEDRYRAEDLTGASEIARQVIAHEPAATPTQVADSWRILAATAEDQKDYAAAEASLLELIALAPGDNSPALRERLAAAVYRQGEAQLEAGNDAQARAEFMRLQELIPASNEPAAQIRATALYDAAAASIRLEDKPQAINQLNSFRSQYPQNKLAPEATRRLAALYMDTGDKRAAAREYAAISKQQDIDAGQRLAAAEQSTTLIAETGTTAEAVDAYKTLFYDYDIAFPTQVETADKLVALYGKTGEEDKADFWREKLIELDAGAGSQRSERSRTLAAQAQLKFAEESGEAFVRARLGNPLRQTLQVKKARLEDALAAYGKAADYGIADITTAATYRTGQLYYRFSRDLLESPRPGNLDAEEAAQYEVLLEEQAFPFEEQAIDIHQANMARAADGIYNEWVRKSQTELAKLLPVRFAKTERISEQL